MTLEMSAACELFSELEEFEKSYLKDWNLDDAAVFREVGGPV